jgi:hypothetical protein
MSRFLEIITVVALATEVPTLAYASTQTHPHHATRHLRASARSSGHSHLSYRSTSVTPANYRSSGKATIMTARFKEGDDTPRLALDSRLGSGANASLGLEHHDGWQVDLHEINSVFGAVPPPSTSLVGAKLSYAF